MTSDPDSNGYQDQKTEAQRPGGWLRMAAVAGASALAGGLAAAWFYRKTLARLREADQGASPSDASRWLDEDGDGV